jgi:hypothetical protein
MFFLTPLCTGSYHEIVDTNGIEDVISGRSVTHDRVKVNASSTTDTFKDHCNINGGCLVQVVLRLRLRISGATVVTWFCCSWTAASGHRTAACANQMVRALVFRLFQGGRVTLLLQTIA